MFGDLIETVTVDAPHVPVDLQPVGFNYPTIFPQVQQPVIAMPALDFTPPNLAYDTGPAIAPVSASTVTQATTPAGPDFFQRDILPLLQVAGQTWIGLTQAQHGGYLPGISPGVPVGSTGTLPGGLSTAQFQQMTPAQQQAYMQMYPSAFGMGGSTGTLFGMDMTTMLLLSGAGLVLFLLLRK